MHTSHSRRTVVRSVASILSVLLALLSSVPQASALPKGQTLVPTPPFSIDAPWPAGLSWEAGGRGWYYGDPGHQNADLYALDFNGPRDSHGQDERGTLVLSIADGQVLQATCKGTGTYGCSVVIGHAGDGDYCYESRYAHLQQGMLVTAGQWIAQGEPLGRVGSTGLGPGNDHLHFAIYRRPWSECASSAIRANRVDMAVAPEPLDGVSPILDGSWITSTNYPVGYESLSADQIRSPGSSLSERHDAILKTYATFGGQYWAFGSTIGPVESLKGAAAWYQEFGPHTYVDVVPWHGLGAAIVEYGESAYLMVQPIWSHYRQEGGPLSSYGPPTSDSYEWIWEGRQGYRSDFTHASVIWYGGQSPTLEVLDSSNAPWEAYFWPEPNSFTGPAYRRRDQYVDFSWPDPNLPGPFLASGGFSTKWQTTAGGLIAAYRIVVEFRGHLEIVVDGKTVLQQHSPSSTSSVKTIRLGIGADAIEIRYWREAPSIGKIRVGVESLFVPAAFASQGEITSSFPASQDTALAAFPPPLREEENVPEDVTALTSPEQVVCTFFEAMERLDVERASKVIAPSGLSRRLDIALLSLYRVAMDLLGFYNDWDLEYQETAGAQRESARLVRVYGRVRIRRLANRRTVTDIKGVDMVVPLSRHDQGWRMDLRVREILEDILAGSRKALAP